MELTFLSLNPPSWIYFFTELVAVYYGIDNSVKDTCSVDLECGLFDVS